MTFFLPKKMKYFMMTMEIKNFSKAAEALCITRSPLSKVIYEMENYFGGHLFRRTYNILEPTELAWDIYNRIKPLYNELSMFEDEFHNKKKNRPYRILFDASFPELLYQHMSMAMKVHGIDAECERAVVDYDEVNKLASYKMDMIVSIRKILIHHDISEEQLIGGGYVIVTPKTMSSKVPGKFLIWKDSYTEHVKAKISHLLSDYHESIEFLEHNFDLLTTLYTIRMGNGSIIMPRKTASIYGIDNTIMEEVNNRNTAVYIYKNSNGIRGKNAGIVKSLITEIM
ncbi:TPA: LysR family transcriptional regulator [Citrobacter braakii]|uniref:LysR family transcriptional regulator n=1 Tax=Citrobacter braakii TaxID=57706 RepID=UPI001B9B44E9|nr:LysR family transcriptional regulator [Citrobacter braakii]HBC8730364.1 LysR family transcriptional regulator [Citrobacter braakii]